MVAIEEYEKLRQRPEGRAVMLQSWRDLTFLHVTIDPARIQPMIPAGLTVDTFPDESGEEKAWLGLVPFRMHGIRPVGLPAVPWLSAFPETNVRTYVHRDGKEPGVWFFSLDAARLLACRYARIVFRLPYFWAKMSVQKTGNEITYQSKRLQPPFEPAVDIQIRHERPTRSSEPGSLDFWLLERYLLYAARGEQLYSGQVAHAAYQFTDIDLLTCHQTMLAPFGAGNSEWAHTAYSPGVDVEVFPLLPV